MAMTQAELVDLLAGAFRSGHPQGEDILAEAIDRHARPEVIATLRTLPERRYQDVREIWAEAPRLLVES